MKFSFKKYKISLILFIVTLILLYICLSILTWIFNQNETLVTFAKNTLEQNTGYPATNSNLDIKMEIPTRTDGVKNCWQEADGSWGSQYDIYVINNTDYPFVDWLLEMSVPDEARIDSSWNGTYIESPGKITISGSAPFLTAIAPPHNNVKVGYVLYTNELMTGSNFYLTGRFLRKPLKDIPFMTSLILVILSFLAFIISLVSSIMVERQKLKDEEKIEDLLQLCARFIDVRDEYTKMHSSHVGIYARKIAKEMGLSEDFQKTIYYMGMMHDVGKVLIPNEILCKTEKLTPEEWFEMRKHTTYGAEILKDFKAIPNIKDAALYHHERYDGKGYPQGLKGQEIPLEARIIGVADSYDAMHTNRSYRVHLSDDVILSELEKNKGSQFDPQAAEAMIRLLKANKLHQSE
ncbi:MAG: HD domain-containing protein [Treponema sp.]|nr:HD domain-containing protein [Treponema sp.]